MAITRISDRTMLALLGAVVLCAGGCLGDFIPMFRTGNSERTATSYDKKPADLLERDRKLEDYLSRLESITPSGSGVGSYRPFNAQISILPNDLNVAPVDEPDAFSRTANIRTVHVPANPRPDSGPQPGQITPIDPMMRVKFDEQGNVITGDDDSAIGVGGELEVVNAGDISNSDSMSPEEIEHLVQPYRQMVYADPENLDKQLQLRLILAAAGAREQALEPIAQLSEQENRRVADLLMMIMSLRGRPQLSPTPEEASQQVLALERLMQKLQTMADLKIPRFELCRVVNGYGNFEKVDSYNFLPNQPVVVYCEVKNFSVSDTGDGMFRTVLDLELGLYNKYGTLVVPAEADTGIEDMSSNRRNDFFLTTIYHMPPGTPPGQYTLKVTITDTKANKVATSSIDITILEQGG